MDENHPQTGSEPGADAERKPAPRIRGVLETVLYASDLAATDAFYCGVLGLRRIAGDGETSAVFRIGPESVLLVFDPAVSERPGRPVPSHGGRGAGHIALGIGDGVYDDWIARLRDAGITIEHEQEWPLDLDPGGERTGRSIYVRDPAGNSVELITGDIWPASDAP